MDENRSGVGFGVFVCVGPGTRELERLSDFLDSLFAYEPSTSLLILIDDSPVGRGLQKEIRTPAYCETIVIVHPRLGRGRGYLGGLFVADLLAISELLKRPRIEFLLKCDTDTLIIGPFAEQIASYFEGHSQIGMVGTLGRTCNPDSADYRQFCESAKYLREIFALVPSADKLTPNEIEAGLVETRFGMVTVKDIIALDEFRDIVQSAADHGYRFGEYLQGGAYAIANSLAGRLLNRGYLAEPLRWLNSPFGEDLMMSICTRAVGMTLQDLSGFSDPFGVQYQGLPYRPVVLRERRHSIIHSIRNDPVCSEVELREFFGAYRRTHGI